jgi:hypothetical protein
MNEITEHAIKGIDLAEAGSAEVLRIADLNVDPEYQRALRHEFVNYLARRWDIVKAGPILVSERDDGKLWVVDGQHRMMAALQAGEGEIFAHVIRGRTRAQEAEMRLARNDRKSDSIQEKFTTRLVMGDQKAHKIVEILHQHGTHLNLSSPNTSSGINAIAAVEAIFDVDSTGVALGRTLNFLAEAFPAEQRPDGSMTATITPVTASANMLKAVVWFLDRHVDSHEVPWTEMVRKVATVGPGDIRRKAVSHQSANGGAMWLNFYRALVEIWNFRRQENSKIPWKTTGSMSMLGEHGRARSTARSFSRGD